MDKSDNIFKKIFGVVIRGQTYLNIIYVAIAFPLGLFYYIFLAVGISLGVPLVIILIGILILLVVFAGWVAFIAFERQLAIWLLRVDVPPYIPDEPSQHGTSNWITGLLRNRATWTGLIFLFLKLPFGVFSFAVMVALFSLTLALLAAPFIYAFYPAGSYEIWFTSDQVWMLNSIGGALLLFLIGIAMIFVSLHLTNALAWVWGKMAYWMLGSEPRAAAEQVTPEPEAGPQPEVQPVEIQPELAPAVAVVAVSETQVSEEEAGTLPPEEEPEVEQPEDDQPLITPPPESFTQVIDEPEPEPAEDDPMSASGLEWLLEHEETDDSESEGAEPSVEDTSPLATEVKPDEEPGEGSEGTE